MDISIVIIVKNDPGIENTLTALQGVRKPRELETIVVDASRGRLNYIKNKFPDVKWIDYANDQNKKISISEQRNLGVEVSCGEIIVFLDANCVPQQRWLEELLKPVIEDGEEVVAGNVKPLDTKTVNTISDERYKGKYLTEAPTLNLLIKRNVINKVGDFDTSLSYGEDVDFTWRVVDAGYKIRYAKHAVVSHDWGGFAEQVRRVFRYGVLRVRLYIKHPYKIKDIYKGESVVALIYPLFIIFIPVTAVFKFYPLLLIIPIVKNYKSNPIKTTGLNLIYGCGVIKGVLSEIAKLVVSRFS